MTNEEKMLDFMCAKSMMASVLDKVLDRINEVAEKLHMEPAEFGLAFFMDCLKTMMECAKEMGYSVDVDGFANALKEAVYGEK